MQATRKRYLVSTQPISLGPTRPTIDPIVVTAADALDAIRAGAELMGFSVWVGGGPEQQSYHFKALVMPDGGPCWRVDAKKTGSCLGPKNDAVAVVAPDEKTARMAGMQRMGLVAAEACYEVTTEPIQELCP